MKHLLIIKDLILSRQLPRTVSKNTLLTFYPGREDESQQNIWFVCGLEGMTHHAIDFIIWEWETENNDGRLTDSLIQNIIRSVIHHPCCRMSCRGEASHATYTKMRISVELFVFVDFHDRIVCAVLRCGLQNVISDLFTVRKKGSIVIRIRCC